MPRRPPTYPDSVHGEQATEVADEDLFPLIDGWRRKWDAKWNRRSSDIYQPRPDFLLQPEPDSALQPESDFAPRSFREGIKKALEEALPPPSLAEVCRYMQELLRLVLGVTHRGGDVGRLRARWASIPQRVRTEILELDTAQHVQKLLDAGDPNPFWSTGPTKRVGGDSIWPVFEEEAERKKYATIDDFVRDHPNGTEVAWALRFILAPGAEPPPRESRSQGLRQRPRELIPKLRISPQRGRSASPWIDSLTARLGQIFQEFSEQLPKSRGAFPDLVKTVFGVAGIAASPRDRIETRLRTSQKGGKPRPRRGKIT